MNREVILVNEALETLVPRIDITLHQYDFSFRVSVDEVLCKADGRRIGHSAVIAEQLIPVLSCEGSAVAVVFGFESSRPCGEVVEFVERRVAMVCRLAAKEFQGGLHRDCASTRHAQGKNLHWDVADTVQVIPGGSGHCRSIVDPDKALLKIRNVLRTLGLKYVENINRP